MSPLERLREDAEVEPELRKLLADARSGPTAAELSRLQARVLGELTAPRTGAAGAPHPRTLGWSKWVLAMVPLVVIVGVSSWQKTPSPLEPKRAAPLHVSPRPAMPKSAPPEAAPSPFLAREAEQPAAAALPRQTSRPFTPARSLRSPARAVRSAEAQERSEDELELLLRARRLVGSAPERALELLERHEREHVRGALGEEREALAIEALLSAHRRPEAERRHRQFLRAHPRSAYTARLHQLFAR